MDCSTIRCIAGFLPDFPESTDSGKYRLLRQDSSMDAASRLIQLAGVFGFTLLFTAIGLLMSLQSGGYEWYTAIKWWILSAAQVAAMIIPVPGKLLNRKLGNANPADSDTGTGNDSQYVPTERERTKSLFIPSTEKNKASP